MLALSLRQTILILLSLTSIAFAFHVPSVVRAQTTPTVGIWSDTYASSVVNDTSLIIGSAVTIEVNVTSAPAFNGYEFTLFYDPGFLKALSVDFRTSTVFNNPFVARNEIGSSGFVAVAVVNLGSSFSGGSGTLAHVRFNVTAVGVSPLTLAAATANPSSAAQSWTRLVNGFQAIDVATSDGYFRDDASRLGPVSKFTFDPPSPLFGDTVFFDASSSFDRDNDTGPNRGIAFYAWDFGDGFSTSSRFPVITHRFGVFQPPPGFSGIFSVRLTVIDSNDGFEGMIDHLVNVSTVLAPSTGFQVSTTPSSQSFLPGGSLVANAFFQSVGGFQGNVSVTARIIPTIPNGPIVSVSSSNLTVSPGAPAVTTVSVVTTSLTLPGSYAVIVTGTSGRLSHLAVIELTVLKPATSLKISVKNSFADKNLNPLPVDSTGNPSVRVLFGRGFVQATNPSVVVSWVNVTNRDTVSFSSLKINETLPVDWLLSSSHRSKSPVHVFFEFTNGTMLDITNSAAIVVSGNNPKIITVALSDISKMQAGKMLGPGESIVFSANLVYGLIGTHQSPKTFPLHYTAMATASAWDQPSFLGAQGSGKDSASFNAVAKMDGDVNGDNNVNIEDLAIVASSFGSSPGGQRWNLAANLNDNQLIDIGDLAVVAFYFGDSNQMNG